MVEVKKVQCLYFSPTGNTKKIVETIAKGTGFPIAPTISLTHPRERELWSGEYEGDLLLVGSPVYGNSYPSMMLPLLQKLHGEGRLAVPVAVCGNCKMGICLAEICGILKKRGFTTLAAGNFVGEHTCASEEYKIGTGRPDMDDLKKAYDFGKKIAAKIVNNQSDITSVYSGQLYIQCYVSGSMEATGYNVYNNNGAWTREVKVKANRTDLDQCKACMRCVEICPMEAIGSETFEINDLLCIRCFECTRICPSNILHKQVIPPPELASWWKIQEKRRGEPLLFI
jgi:ferredoxin/flavodoxin